MTEHAHFAIAENAVVQSNAPHQVREVGAKQLTAACAYEHSSRGQEEVNSR
jgi:hypothetical protein